jgi:hypothetical protein
MAQNARAEDNVGDDKMIVQLTAGELRALVRDEMSRAARAIAEAKPPSPSDRWTDVEGAAKHFKCSGRTIRNWIKQGAPARTFGPAAHAMIRLDLAEFEAWVDHSNRTKRSAP